MRIVGFLLVIFGLTACGNSPGPAQSQASAESVTISAKSLYSVWLGPTMTVDLTGMENGSKSIDQTVSATHQICSQLIRRADGVITGCAASVSMTFSIDCSETFLLNGTQQAGSVAASATPGPMDPNCIQNLGFDMTDPGCTQLSNQCSALANSFSFQNGAAGLLVTQSGQTELLN